MLAKSFYYLFLAIQIIEFLLNNITILNKKL